MSYDKHLEYGRLKKNLAEKRIDEVEEIVGKKEWIRQWRKRVAEKTPSQKELDENFYKASKDKNWSKAKELLAKGATG